MITYIPIDLIKIL